MEALNLKQGVIKNIVANQPAANYEFDQWSGDVDAVNDIYSPNTFVTMPNRNIEVTALYKSVFNTINYGALYNWYAATDARNIANTGWGLSDHTDWRILAYYLVNYNIGQSVPLLGGKIKEIGTTHWLTPNTGAEDNVGFGARGAGRRGSNGIFSLMNENVDYHVGTLNGSYGPIIWSVAYSTVNGAWMFNTNNYKAGTSIRLVKDSTTLTHGQTGTYIGNDGRPYRTICIGTQEWLAENLAETKYRNGDWIHGYENGVYTPISTSVWAALTTEGMCLYNDDLNNK